MRDIISLLIDHGDDDYDYYERLAVAVERLAVAVGLPLLIQLIADSACRVLPFFCTPQVLFFHRHHDVSCRQRRTFFGLKLFQLDG